MAWCRPFPGCLAPLLREGVMFWPRRWPGGDQEVRMKAGVLRAESGEDTESTTTASRRNSEEDSDSGVNLSEREGSSCAAHKPGYGEYLSIYYLF